MSQVTIVRQESTAVTARPVAKRNLQDLSLQQQHKQQQQQQQQQQADVTTLKRVRIDMENVQKMVDCIRSDFDRYQDINSALRMTLLSKKKELESMGTQTNDLSSRLGIVGAKVSVNQKIYLQQKKEFAHFDEEVDKITNNLSAKMQFDLREVLDLTSEMFNESSEIQEENNILKQSLQDKEVRLGAVMSSINDLSSAMGEFTDLNSTDSSEMRTLVAGVSQNEADIENKNEELRALVEDLTSLKVVLSGIDHAIQVNECQAADQASSFSELKNCCDSDLRKLKDKAAALKEKALSQLWEDTINKKAHLKRLKDDIQSKMEDTHKLNRECDKAMINLSTLEVILEELRRRTASTAALAGVAKEAKEMAAEQLRNGEQELIDAQERANLSEQRLTSRIKDSKASISAFFELKKKANAKEWEVNKAKSTVEKAIGVQRQSLTDVESQIMVTDVEMIAASKEIELKEKELAELTSFVVFEENNIADKEIILSQLNQEGNKLVENRAFILTDTEQFQELLRAHKFEAMKEASAKRSLLENEAVRLDKLLHSIDQQLLQDNEEIEKVLEEIEEATRTEEDSLTLDEISDAQDDAEKQFLEWQHGEEFQRLEHEHRASLREFRIQIEQLEGRTGELFPQVSVDRNNEISTLKKKISETRDSMKNDKFSDLISNIEKSISNMAKESCVVATENIKGKDVECSTKKDLTQESEARMNVPFRHFLDDSIHYSVEGPLQHQNAKPDVNNRALTHLAPTRHTEQKTKAKTHSSRRSAKKISALAGGGKKRGIAPSITKESSPSISTTQDQGDWFFTEGW